LEGSSPSENPIFFLDRCLGRYEVAKALRGIGVAVEVYSDRYPGTDRQREVSDREWLAEVGALGRVVLSKDKNIRRNQIELAALLSSGAPAFVLTAGSIKGEEMGRSFVAAMPKIRRFLRRFKPPFVATVSRSGAVQIFLTAAEIHKRSGGGRK
jgi:hypothetical protein